MKFTLLLGFVAFFAINLSAQSSYYEVVQVGTNYTLEEIEEAFDSASMCGFIYQSQRNTITFDDGTTVELLGANELDSTVMSCSGVDNSKTFQPAEWSISQAKLIRKLTYTLPKK